MNAKKCDRCGNYYDEEDIECSIALSDHIDLCPECMDKMIDFLKGKLDIYNIQMPVIASVEDMKYAMPLIESIPKDMRDRVCSIEQSADGDITMYLDIYFQNEDNKDE